MPVEVYSQDRKNISSYYGYKFKINHLDECIEFENGDVIYFDSITIMSGMHNSLYLEVICK